MPKNDSDCLVKKPLLPKTFASGKTLLHVITEEDDNGVVDYTNMA